MGLRTIVLQGGIYYSVRQLLGAAIGVAGVTCLTRILGPHDYGAYAAGLGLYLFLSSVCQMGIGTYLVRKEGDCDEGEYSLALLIVLAIGFVTIPLAVISVRYLEPWTGIPHFAAMTSALLLALPAALCSSITFARLERAIDYRSVAAADLAGQCSYYALALPVAYLGGGVWARVGGRKSC
jgi:O-antigen/teichoic acid export membrane protein